MTAPPCDWNLSAAAFDNHLASLDALAEATAWADFNRTAARFIALNDSDNRPLALALYRTVLAEFAASRAPAPWTQLTLIEAA